jgi:nickel/cobalt transporter (NicO) family protein
MRRAVVLVALASAALVALVTPTSARAHPLGNFTVNHYAGIELAGDALYVRFVLDFAEIPAFQLGSSVRQAGFANSVTRSLDLRLDGRRVSLATRSSRIVERPGAGGLPTLRFEAILSAPAAGGTLSFADRTFADRIGWREITVSSRDGARVEASSVPSTSRSDELRAYPQDLLRSPLDVRSATAGFEPGDPGAAPARLGETSAAPPHTGGGFEALIERGALSPGVVLLSLLVAAFWGAAHALTPGHGKALVAGYLVGTKGRPRDAVLLGATVTITHTAGVFALGLVTLLLSQFIVPEHLYPWLTLVSGLLVVVVGVSVLRARAHGATHGHVHDHGHHHHHEGPGDHDHPHPHDDDPITSKGILGIGVAAGLLPCPSALVVLLSAIALHRLGFGFALIAAFSVGLAVTITSIGLLAVLARRAFSRASLDGRVVRALPAVSALVIVGVGVALTAKALPGVL